MHNAGLVQSGGCFTVLYSGNFASPGEYLFADATQQQHHWFWPMGGEIGADGNFHVFVAEMRENGSAYLTKTEPIATWLVTIDLATMQVVDRRPAVNSSNSLYGFSVASDDAYTYLYAHCHRQFGWSAFPFVSPPVYVHDFGCVQKMTVARTPKGRFDQPLEYWNGAAWVGDPAAAANIVPGGRLVSASQFYRTAPGTWVAVTKVGDWFGDTIEIDVASSPQGPYRTVRTISVPRACNTCNNYFASLLPYASSDGRWILGLSQNVFGDLDLSRYDPTFFAINRSDRARCAHLRAPRSLRSGSPTWPTRRVRQPRCAHLRAPRSLRSGSPTWPTRRVRQPRCAHPEDGVRSFAPSNGSVVAWGHG